MITTYGASKKEKKQCKSKNMQTLLAKHHLFPRCKPLKVGLSHSKKICFIYFNKSPLKMRKNAVSFCFTLKALFVFKILKLSTGKAT